MVAIHKGFHIWVASDVLQSPWGWHISRGSSYFPPYFAAEETEAQRDQEVGLGHTSGLGTGLQTQTTLPSELITASWAP